MSLKFKDGKFTIMQIADVQENYPVNADTVKLIELAVEKEKPDLVVFTGDQISGYSFCYKKDTENRVARVIEAFTKPLSDRGIVFTFTFGNHDDDCRVGKKEQLEIYKRNPLCLMGAPRSEDDPGTHCLKIRDSKDERDIFAIYILDSNKKEADNSYSGVKEKQLSWLMNERENNGYIPALCFQHIPVPEYYDVLEKVPFYKKGAVEAYRSRKNTFYRLSEGEGFMGETPAVPETNGGEFELLSDHGDILGLFVGHDHNNSFVRRFKNIDLGYTQGSGFNTYGPGDKRGVRVFKLSEDNLKKYESYTVTIGELCSYKPSKPFQEFVFRNVPSSVAQVKTTLKRVGTLAAAAVAIGALVRSGKHV